MQGWTPAHHAAEKGHVSFLRVLKEYGAGASLSAANMDHRGWTPAHLASPPSRPEYFL